MQDFNEQRLEIGDLVAFVNGGVLTEGSVRGTNIKCLIKVGVPMMRKGYFLIYEVKQEQIVKINPDRFNKATAEELRDMLKTSCDILDELLK